MGKGLPHSLSRGNPQKMPVAHKVVKFTALPVTVDGATGVGFGTAVMGDFPEGNLLFLGAVAYAQFTGPGSASVGDTWQGNFAIGSTPTADATLSTTDADIVGSTALAAATAEVSPRTRGTGVTAAILDNTDGSLELNLNFTVADADISADDLVFLATGELHVVYAVLGDD